MTRRDGRVTTGADGRSRWRRVLRLCGVDLRAGEGALALLLFFCFFLFITFQYATKSVRQSTFIDSRGAAELPWVYLSVALLSYPFLLLYSRFANRVAKHRLMAGTCGVVGASMVACWWVFPLATAWLPYALYVWVSLVYVMTVSQFWAFATTVLDPRQAKRLFGFVGAGGLLGGILGGQVAKVVAGVADTRATFLVAAVLLALGAGLILVIHRRHPAIEETTGDAALAKLERAQSGLKTVRASRHLRLIAGIVVLTTIVAQIVDLQFSWAVEQATTGLDQRTAFFGNFYTLMGISALLFQLVFTARIHRALGVGVALRISPVVMGLGTALLFGAASFAPALLLTSAAILKIGENGLRYSLDQATRELLFLPVPSTLRVKAKAFIDVFVARGAKGLAALLLLPVTFGLVTVVDIGWVTLGLIVVWLAATVFMYREYVRSFRAGLRDRRVDAAAPINLADVTTLEILVQSLGSSDPGQVLHALEILAANGRGSLVPPLLLYHDAPEVRLRTLQVLAETGRHDLVPLVERRLGDADPLVRAEAIRTLGALERRDVVELMLPRLEEPDACVRAAAVACLAANGAGRGAARAEAVLRELMRDADPLVRAEAAKAIGAVPEPRCREELLRLLSDAEPTVVRQAIAAARRRVARDGQGQFYVATLVALLRNRRVKHEAREALVALGEPVLPVLGHFVSDRDEPLWVRRALPKTIARVGGTAAVDALVGSLAARDDLFLRRKVIEALASLAARRPLSERGAALTAEIGAEAAAYLQALADLRAVGLPAGAQLVGPVVLWDRAAAPPELLHSLLAERLEAHVSNLCGLLAMLHSAKDITAAQRGLVCGRRATLTGALEYLDNLLSGEVRRHVFAVIGDAPLADKLAAGHRVYGTRTASRHETLARLMAAGPGGTADDRDLALAAVYFTHTERLADLYATVRELAAAPGGEALAATARWVVNRLGSDVVDRAS